MSVTITAAGDYERYSIKREANHHTNFTELRETAAGNWPLSLLLSCVCVCACVYTCTVIFVQTNLSGSEE